MSQFRPSNLIPSTLTSYYSIDATVDNTFSCQINGTSPTLKYQLVIMANTTSSNTIYDSGVVSLSEPLYPVNYDGTINSLSVVVPSTSGMVNGQEYKWTISSYWSDDDYYTSYDNVINAYETPTLSIASVPTELTSKSYEFIGEYSQSESQGVESFGWILENVDTGAVIEDTITTGNIYSSDIKLVYDGFLSGSNYRVMCKCWASNGISLETPYTEFSVSYDEIVVEGQVVAETTIDSGVSVQWSNIFSIFGNATNDDYSFNNDLSDLFDGYYLYLEEGNSVVYDEVSGSQLSISTNTTHTISFYVSEENDSIYYASGVDGSGNGFTLKIFSETTSSGALGIYVEVSGENPILLLTTSVSDKFFTVVITPTTLYFINQTTDMEGLLPDDELYPDEDLTPDGGATKGLVPSASLYPNASLKPTNYSAQPLVTEFSLTGIPIDGTYSELSISGEQSVHYIWLVDGVLDDSYITSVQNLRYIPIWTTETVFLTTFDNSFSAGNTTSTSDVVGWDVYRLDEDYSVLKHIRTLPKEYVTLTDYTNRNLISSEYYVFAVFEDEIGVPTVSNSVTPSRWSWDLIVCSTSGTDNVFDHVSTYIFDLDVSSGSLSNNTEFTILSNFTKYAKVQRSDTNYWSGTLGGLIGSVVDGKYVDTVSQMNEMKNLTTDGYDKFLKDRKGNIWKIDISDSIAETIHDTYTEQAVVVSIPWIEVDDASSYSVTG